MSSTHWQTTRDSIAELTTAIAWDQWRALGGSVTGVAEARSLIDPEALVLVSLALSSREPRLTDVLESWVEHNAPLLSVQRLRNLRRDYPATIEHAVTRFAARARALARHPRWGALSDAPEDTRSDVTDARSSRRAIDAPSLRPVNLLLRLRLGFGVGTKADVLGVCLSRSQPLTAKQLSDITRYTTVSVRSAIEDLERAGFVQATGQRPKSVEATRGWAPLLGLATIPPHRNWHALFAVAVTLSALVDDASAPSSSDYAIAAKVRNMLQAWEGLLYQSWKVPALNTSGGELAAALGEWLLELYEGARKLM